MVEFEEACVHVDRMRGVVDRMLRQAFKGNRSNDADDVLQNAKVLIWQHIQNFEHRSKLRTWVHRVVINEALMEIRRGMGATRIGDAIAESLDESHSDGANSGPHFDAPDPAPNPEELAAEKVILKQVAKLSPAYRRVFELHVIEGFEHNEIAKITGRTSGASKSNFFKARNNLRKLLENK